MNTNRRAGALLSVFIVAWTVGSGFVLAAQDVAPVARAVLTPEQTEAFLLNARILDSKAVNKGVTNTRRATLSDGRITHDAQIQTVEISKPLFQPDFGPAETNFRDSYLYNIAAYRLSRLLGLNDIPVSVERRVDGKLAAITWWVDDVAMDESARRKKETNAQMSSRTAGQVHIMRVFDELISNNDRNAGNLLWDTNGDMWMIDHTRAFRLNPKLKAPKLLERMERGLLEKMRGLTLETVKGEVGNSLNRGEIEAMLARRDEIVKVFEGLIAQRGERSVLYTLQPR